MAEWTSLIAPASGFLMLAGLIVGLIAWLRTDMNRRMDRIEVRMDRLETGQGGLRSRVDRIDGQLDAMPAAVGRAVAEAVGKPRARRARFEHASRRAAIR